MQVKVQMFDGQLSLIILLQYFLYYRMDHYTIATSLKRVDKKFTEELSEQERQTAYRKFKKVYACKSDNI